ncbi:RTA1 like protein, partial [Mollisia scopiformis]
RYDPSIVAAVISMICFLVSTCVHIFQASKYRTYYFIPFIVGGLLDTTGFLGRILAHSHPYDLNIYVVQTIFILLAPALFAASIYMTLERIILFTRGEKIAPIPARWLSKIFVCGDAILLMVQAAGGGLMVTKSMLLGEHLVVTGLLLQIICFGIFVVTSGIFHYRMVRLPFAISPDPNWQKFMYTLYVASSLIFIRSIFRVIEFLGGNDGVLMRHEISLYIVDGVMMLAVMASFNAFHPGK